MKKLDWSTVARFVLGGLVILVAASGVPIRAAGEVSLPMDEWNEIQNELKTLRETSTRKTPDLPPEAAISSASYTARPVRGGLKIRARLSVVAIGTGKTKIPLFSGTVAVTGSQVSSTTGAGSAGCVLSSGPDGTHLLVQAPGRYTLDLDVVAIGEGTSATFGIPRTGANLFRIELPGATSTAKIEPSVGVTRTMSSGLTVVETVLPPTETVRVEWSSVGGAVAQEQGEGRLYLTTHLAALIEQESIRGRARLDYEIKGGVAFEFALRLPRDIAVAEVTGDGISHWKVETGENESLLVIHPQSPMAGTARFLVSWDAPLPRTSQIAEIPRFRGVKVAREVGMVGVAAGDATGIGSEEARGLVPIDPRTAPEALASMLDRPLSWTGRFASDSWSLSVAMRRLEAVEVIAARIEEAMGASVLLPSGRTVHRFVALVRNSTVDFLDLTLPAGSRIWGAAVGGKIVRPIRGKDANVFRLPLVRAQSAEAGGTVFGVEIVYAIDADRSLAVGRFQVQPPVLSLDAGRHAWALHVPSEYRIAGAWGWGDWERADAARWSTVAASLRDGGHDAPASWLGFPTEALDGPVRTFSLSSSDAGSDPRTISLFYLTNRFGAGLEVLVLLAGLVATLIPLRRWTFSRRMRIAAVAVTLTAIVLQLFFNGMLIRLVQGIVAGLLFAIAGFLMRKDDARPETASH
jgi:hypothetical protein